MESYKINEKGREGRERARESNRAYIYNIIISLSLHQIFGGDGYELTISSDIGHLSYAPLSISDQGILLTLFI